MKISIVDRLRRDRRGNVAIVLALAAVPLLFAIGMGMDYTSASFRENQLNAFADAAALAALKPAIMAQSDQASINAATSTFNAQASSVPGVTYDPNALTVAVKDTSGGVSVTRTVTVSYTAASQNAFLGILGTPSIALAGSSQGTAKAAPNINFYLLLDSSPSMLIGATQADINKLMAATPTQDKPNGCGFACHETNPSADNLGNPNGEDNYALARNLKITLRIDNLVQATKDLMTTAQQVANTDNAQYQMAIYTFDVAFNTIQTLTSSLSLAQAAAGNIQALTVYDNNCLTKSNCNSDADTDYDNAMNNINKVMPTPGNGTNAAGDTPQEVMFFVTDGMEDEGKPRVMSVMNPTWCTTIKNRGIRIAVLYTTYLPLPTDSWYVNSSGIPKFLPNVEPSLQACASSPQLYTRVDNGSDISTALQNLFEQAVATAYLSK
jgi:Flp pilus assembly protein TadG